MAMTVDMTSPASVGAALKAEVRKLAAEYQTIAGLDLAGWNGVPLPAWRRIWDGLEAADTLESFGRRVFGLKGCPFGPSLTNAVGAGAGTEQTSSGGRRAPQKGNCPPESPWRCDACAGLPQGYRRVARGIGDPRLACPGGTGHLVKWSDLKGNEWCFSCCGIGAGLA